MTLIIYNLKSFIHLSPGLSVAAKYKSQNYRGLVETYDPNTKVAKLKLVDTGETVNIPVDDLAEMPKSLRKTNQVTLVAVRIEKAGEKLVINIFTKVLRRLEKKS